MKRIIILIAATLFFATQIFSQVQLGKVVEKYYRVNPFEGSFPAFVKALSSDPELQDKVLIPKSDTSTYFLKGNYKVFNPFNMNAQKVEMVFSEQDLELGSKNILTSHTVYTYQILAYFNDTKQNREQIVKEYNKIRKQLRKDMAIDISTLKGFQNIEDGEIANFYYSNSPIYPITLSWQTLTKSKHIAITIVCKLLVYNNRAQPGGELVIVSQ